MSSLSDLPFLEQVENIDQKISNCISEISKLLQSVDSFGETYTCQKLDDKQTRGFGLFLQQLISSIHGHYNLEEFIYPHVSELRMQNGINLVSNPCKCQCDQSCNIDACLTDSIQYLWEKLCYHLEKHSFEKFSLISGCVNCENIRSRLTVKAHIITLKSIYTPSLAWEMYKDSRLSSIRQCRYSHTTDAISNFPFFVNVCLNNIHEDMLLICTGQFHPVIVTCTNLLNMYIVVIQEKLFEFLDGIQEWRNHKISLSQSILNFISYLSPVQKGRNFKTCISCWISEENHRKFIKIFEDIVKHFEDTNCFQWQDQWNSAYAYVIIKTIEILYFFEYRIMSYFANKRSGRNTLHLHTLDLSFLSEGINFTLPLDSPDPSPLHEPHIMPAGENSSFSWNWRSILVDFGCLIYLQRILQSSVQLVISKSVGDEKEFFFSSHGKNLCTSDILYEIPLPISKGCKVFSCVLKTIAELEIFEPLLFASEGQLSSFKSSFSHIINSYVIDLLKHLDFISKGVPHKFSAHWSYAAVSSAIFLKDSIQKYDTLLMENNEVISESPLNSIHNEVNELVDSLKENLFHLHMKYITCGIFMDSDSNNWKNSKPFYEGERVSYSIQMYNLYMKSVLNDAKYYLPQQVAQELYGRILCDSLYQLLLRYSHLLPSEGRTPQVRDDIVTLLLCVSELLFPACNYASQFVGKVNEDDQTNPMSALTNRIHSTCCTFLCVMAVLTSPLSELCKVYKKGFPHMSLSLRTKYICVTPWLPWIRITLFPESGKVPLMSTVAVWLAVQVCASWAQLNPESLLRAFTEHQCTLSILLMTQAVSYENVNTDLDVHIEDCKFKLGKAIFQLLLCFDHHPSYLYDVLFPVIEKTNGWEEFDGSRLNRILNERPWWYQAFVNFLKPFAKSVLGGFFPTLFSKEKHLKNKLLLDAWREIRSGLGNFINCTCEEMESNDVSEECIPLKCVYDIFVNIYDCLILLPQPLKNCLAYLDLYLSNSAHSIEPVHQSLPVQVLLSTLYCYLMNNRIFEDLIGCNLSKEGSLLCCMTADLLLTFGNGMEVMNSTTNLLSSSITKKILHIKQHFCDIRSNFESSLNLKESEELESKTLLLSATELLQQPDGEETLLYLQKILYFNAPWIQQSLGIPEMLCSNSVVNPISPSPLSHFRNQDSSESLNRNIDSGNSRKLLSFRGATSAVSAIADDHISHEMCFDSADEPHGHVNTRIEELQWNHMSEAKVEVQHSSFNINVDSKSYLYAWSFNPFDHFNKLGDNKFDQKTVSEFPISWEALLSHLPILGLTEVGFCALLSQRSDMRSENYLTSDQREWVQELKNKYKI